MKRNENVVFLKISLFLLICRVCFEKLIKSQKGRLMAHGVSVIDAAWIVELCAPLCKVSREPLEMPLPRYDAARDAVLCSYKVTYGKNAWPLANKESTFPASASATTAPARAAAALGGADEYKYFAQALLSGEVIADRFAALKPHLVSHPSLCTRPYIQKKVIDLVTPLAYRKIASRKRLEEGKLECLAL